MSTIAQELGTRVDPYSFVSYRRTDKEFVEARARRELHSYMQTV